MKKFVFGIALAMVTFGLTTSCSSDDDNGGTTPPAVDNELVGNVTSNTTLDASIAYKLTGPLLVNAGSTLTIPAGTKITAAAQGTSVYIAVLKGGKINIAGEPSNPVVMSSANGNQGDWGGLVICGKAHTTAVDEDLDGAQAEIGGFIYGSFTEENNADNSGSIKNLVVKGTGAAINPDSEYNGISFYAVGSGTTVENVAIINGSDDGVEFFGGSVVAKNLYLEDCNDDAVDWTEGWNGGVENVVVIHNQAGYSTAIEADGDNANPTITNFTAIAQNEGKALQFKKQSGATMTNVYLQGYSELVDMKDDGPLSNVIVDGTALNETSANEASTFQGTQVDYSSWTWKDASL